MAKLDVMEKRLDPKVKAKPTMPKNTPVQKPQPMKKAKKGPTLKPPTSPKPAGSVMAPKVSPPTSRYSTRKP